MKHLMFFLVVLALVSCQAPPGEKILVRAFRKGWFLDSGSYLTYAVSVDGSGEIPFSLPPGLDDEFEWSPDGRWIVFSTLHSEGAGAGGNSEIYLMRSNGSNKLRLTDYTYDDTNPTWSPDGTLIAYNASLDINVMDMSCLLKNEQCYPQPKLLAKGDSPSWSSDGKYIVYESPIEHTIFTIKADGSGEPMRFVPELMRDCIHPQWSHRENKILLDCADGFYVVNSDGSNPINIRQRSDRSQELNAEWSPDGGKIVYVSRSPRLGLGKCINGSCGSSGIYSSALFIMDADGLHTIRLTKRDDESVIWFAWLPSQSLPAKP